MKKTDKKLDNALREVLTEACDIALEKFAGFRWLTHVANYNDFPSSLSVVCVFATNEQLANADLAGFRLLLKEKLASMSVQIKAIDQQLVFDTEENCEKYNNGKWSERLLSAL